MPRDGAWGYTKPLGEKTIQTVFNSLAKDSSTRIRFGGYIPPSIVAYQDGVNYNKFMWRTPPRQQEILFTKDAKVKSGKYWVPGLLWRLSDELSIYAYKEWKDLNTALYKAPFLNVSTCSVCLGTANNFLSNALQKSKDFIGVLDSVENAFWLSRFDHMGTDETQIKGSFIDMYKKSRTAPPNEFLVSLNKSLKGVINEEFSS